MKFEYQPMDTLKLLNVSKLDLEHIFLTLSLVLLEDSIRFFFFFWLINRRFYEMLLRIEGKLIKKRPDVGYF